MLRLIIGRAGTGKTALIIGEIKKSVDGQSPGSILIVPEQYSHEAERELCRVCGDSLSRFAEVFSFTGLARRTASRLGGCSVPYLDKGGRLLCMALALSGVSTRLRVYGAAVRKAELQPLLLAAVDEMKTACISPEALSTAAARCGGGLGEKLEDLALIAEAYDAVVANGHADPSDRLTVLADQIPDSDLGENSRVYVDGFIDFTRQEQEVLCALMKKGVELTVCLTVDELDGDSEVFAMSRRSAHMLLSRAKELGIEAKIEKCTLSGDKNEALGFFTENMFSWCEAQSEDCSGAVELWCAESLNAECELAAAKAIELVREKGCRWRDIAVAVRGFDDYRAVLESVFEHYGVPLFVSRKSDLMAKPLPAMVALAYETVTGGWDVDDVVSYIRTGLAGLDEEECDTLENYIFKWQLRGSAWTGSAVWRQHPGGYGLDYTPEVEEQLAVINELRHKAADPLLSFEKRAREAHTASEQAAALALLFADMKLPELLERRAAELQSAGRESLAGEYLQLWELIVSALEQCAAILGDTAMGMEEFGKLFTLMLSKYDVGVIPVSLDRVSAGDFDRMRRRSIKHLIVLGASDERIPQGAGAQGVFSDEERRRLLELEIDLGCTGESVLWREFALIYNCLALPSQTLTLSYPAVNNDGAAQRPAFVMNRAAALFGKEIRSADRSELSMSAPAPAMTLAARALRGGGGREQAAAEYFREAEPQRFARLEAAAEMSRGRLSPMAVEALYGRELELSASKAERFSTCKFAYFCQYGLKAEPYEPADFAPPEIGRFMHYVLEKTVLELKEREGLKPLEDGSFTVSDEELRLITEGHINDYIKNVLNDYHEKSSRFIYLFERLSKDVYAVVTDMVDELRHSAFEPLSFELNLRKEELLPPIRLGDGESELTLNGVADRVDGWLHDGKLYLRIADYKTGKKQFSLSDVWYGMGLQMLMYLFTLEEYGDKLYTGGELAPAGVMYVPARNSMLSADSDLEPQELEKQRRSDKRRSGILLDDEELIKAWDKSENQAYIPLSSKGKKSEAAAISAERFALLSQHIKETLTEMASQLRRGEIAADPFYLNQTENACVNCKFFEACHFVNGENGESCRFTPKLTPDKVWEKLEGGEEHE